MALSIAHLSFSSSGGAGGVASRLASEQRRNGLQAKVVSAISGSLSDSPLQKPLHTLAAAIDEYVIKNPRFPAPISLMRDYLGVRLEGLLSDADVLHIHWPHGLVKLSELKSLADGRPVVWTLHDMNALTSVCHYTLDCEGCWGESGKCRAVRRPFEALSLRHLEWKQEVFSELDNLRFVSPSSWLAQVASKSPVLSSRQVAVIPNPLPSTVEQPVSRQELRHELGIAVHQTAFGVVVANTKDPLKSVDLAVEAYRQAFPTKGFAKLLIAGRHPGQSDNGVVWLGELNRQALTRLYQALDFLVVPSLAENQPLAIAEAQANGTPVLVRRATGLPEHLDIDPLGATFEDAADCASLMATVASAPPNAQRHSRLAEAAKLKFDPHQVHLKYLDVYRQSGQP